MQDSSNIFAYCNNNPILNIDFNGQFTIRRWMVAFPIDVVLIAAGAGLFFAPIKQLAKAAGKAFAKTQFKGLVKNKIITFLLKFRNIANKVSRSLVNAIKKIPLIKGFSFIKKLTAASFSSMFFGWLSKTAVYKFATIIASNIDICLSIGGFVSGILDYAFDKKINNVIIKI